MNVVLVDLKGEVIDILYGMAHAPREGDYINLPIEPEDPFESPTYRNLHVRHVTWGLGDLGEREWLPIVQVADAKRAFEMPNLREFR